MAKEPRARTATGFPQAGAEAGAAVGLFVPGVVDFVVTPREWRLARRGYRGPIMLV
nr:hypothetical protein StreXyl84_69890 [Streptomyces sp. Xyl84]